MFRVILLKSILIVHQTTEPFSMVIISPMHSCPETLDTFMSQRAQIWNHIASTSPCTERI